MRCTLTLQKDLKKKSALYSAKNSISLKVLNEGNIPFSKNSLKVYDSHRRFKEERTFFVSIEYTKNNFINGNIVSVKMYSLVKMGVSPWCNG